MFVKRSVSLRDSFYTNDDFFRGGKFYIFSTSFSMPVGARARVKIVLNVCASVFSLPSTSVLSLCDMHALLSRVE